jgi:hypothetical protein
MHFFWCARRLYLCLLCFVLIILLAKSVFQHNIESRGESLVADNLFSTDIMRTARQDVNSNAPQALGFRCIHCRGEFGSQAAMACPRRHPASIGTPCEDPNQVHIICRMCQCVIFHCSGTWYPRCTQFISIHGFIYFQYFLLNVYKYHIRHNYDIVWHNCDITWNKEGAPWLF